MLSKRAQFDEAMTGGSKKFNQSTNPLVVKLSLACRQVIKYCEVNSDDWFEKFPKGQDPSGFLAHFNNLICVLDKGRYHAAKLLMKGVIDGKRRRDASNVPYLRQPYIITIQSMLDNNVVTSDNLKTISNDIKNTELAAWIAWNSDFVGSKYHFPVFDGEFGVVAGGGRTDFIPTVSDLKEASEEAEYTEKSCNTLRTEVSSNRLQQVLEEVCQYFLNENHSIYHIQCERLKHFNGLLCAIDNGDLSKARELIKGGKSSFGAWYINLPLISKCKINPLRNERYKKLMEKLLDGECLSASNVDKLRDEINQSIISDHIGFYFDKSVFGVEALPKMYSVEYQQMRGYLDNQSESAKVCRRKWEDRCNQKQKSSIEQKPEEIKVDESSDEASVFRQCLTKTASIAAYGLGIYFSAQMIGKMIEYLCEQTTEAASTLGM